MSESRSEWGDPQPPYGPAMLDAVARGDLNEMKAVADAARQSLYGVRFQQVADESQARQVADAINQLEAAIRRLEAGAEPTGGTAGREEWGDPRIPYGPPIMDAIARGDLNEMKAVAVAARQSLYGIRFREVTDDNQRREVTSALAELEAAIGRLEQQQ